MNRIPACSIPQIDRFFAAVPVVGFVHSHSVGPDPLKSESFERRPSDARTIEHAAPARVALDEGAI